MRNAETVVKQLIEAKAKAKANADGWKAEEKKIDAQLAEIIGPEEILSQAGKLKDGGSMTVERHGGKFCVEAAKKIKWDSALLQKVAQKLTYPQVFSIFKVTFEISEMKYKNLVEHAQAGMFDPNLLKEIDDARTVEIGEPKIKTAEIIKPKA